MDDDERMQALGDVVVAALAQVVHHHPKGEACNNRCGRWFERLAKIPDLNASEIQVLLHGLNRLEPSFDITRHLDTFLPTEIKPIVDSLATALLEALADARR